MQQFFHSYITRVFRCLLPGVFLLVAAVQSYSQTAVDTTAPADEVIQEQPVADEDYSNEEEDEYEEKEYFSQKEASDSFRVNERRLPQGYAAKLKEDNDFWYADESFNRKKEKKPGENKTAQYVPLGQRTWVQTLLWIIIIGGFAAAIGWYLADSNVRLFRKRNTEISGGAAGEEEIPEDIFAINYQKEIDKAAAQGNYRLAVRLMFLRLLKNLSEKNIIQYKQDRTNLDYLMQLHPTKYYRSFFRLTRHFEYSWYGHFEVEEGAYRIIAGEFSGFEKEI